MNKPLSRRSRTSKNIPADDPVAATSNEATVTSPEAETVQQEEHTEHHEEDAVHTKEDTGHTEEDTVLPGAATMPPGAEAKTTSDEAAVPPAAGTVSADKDDLELPDPENSLEVEAAMARIEARQKVKVTIETEVPERNLEEVTSQEMEGDRQEVAASSGLASILAALNPDSRKPGGSQKRRNAENGTEANAPKQRCCGLCRQPGHTRGTCSLKELD